MQQQHSPDTLIKVGKQCISGTTQQINCSFVKLLVMKVSQYVKIII